MSRECVIVADAARARLFSVQPPTSTEGGPRLVEERDLVNTESQLKGKELFSNIGSGRDRAPGGGPAHGFDDHRSQHLDEVARRFVRRLAPEINAFAVEQDCSRLLLVVEPHLLGLLRPVLEPLLSPSLAVEQLAEDLSWQGAKKIQDVLVRRGLLEAEQLPEGIYRPRAQLVSKAPTRD